MKRFLLIPLTLFLLFLVTSDFTQAEGIDLSEPISGAALCKPGVKGDCLALGPTRYQERMAEKGIHLPFEPLQGDQPDYELTFVPYLYGEVVNPRAPVYGSIEDAARAKNPIRRMEGDFLYISYTYTEVFNGMRVYMVEPGVWMNANDVHRIGTPNFQGLVFNKTPRNPFGWILQNVETKYTPGYHVLDYSGNWFYRLEILQVYDIKEIDGTEWIMIKPGEWIEKRFIGILYPRQERPEGVEGSRWVDINLYEQTIAAYEDSRLLFATMVSSGIDPFWTRPGLFQIYQKLDTTPMSGSFEVDRSDYYYLEDVPWTMYFDQARALHGAYWHTGYGYPRSHGCVNMSPGDAQWLFNWAQEGDWVYVYDPSGVTPVDPSLYTAGGA